MQLVEAVRSKSQPLAEDYCRHFEKVAERFDYHPWQEGEWERRADWLASTRLERAPRGGLIDVLTAYNLKQGNDHEAVRHSLALLAQEETLVVTGGQQAGLFTGPLLVIYKAVSVIRLAREASAKLGKPVVPVFWIAGEDHDFDEVNHWYALTGQLAVERFRLEHPTGKREAVSRLAFESWADALAKMEEWLQDSDFKPELMARLREYADSSRTLTDYFARIMGWLFGAHGLVLLDSDDPALRRLESPMFQRLLADCEELNRCVLTGSAVVAELGYTPQADQTPGQANLFFYNDEGERTLLYRDGDSFANRKRTFRIERAELERLAREEPWRFSNNVMTRPMMQDYLLPVLAVVLGPGEIAYWALTREAFHRMGLRLPLIMPRLEFTLIEGTVHKNMEKFGLTYDAVMDRFDDFREEWLMDQGQYEVEELFSETRRRFLELYRPVLETVASLNPGLAKLGETNRQKIVEQIDYLRNRAADSLQSKFSSGLRQLDRIHLSLNPLSKPQERVYNVFAYLNRYGSGWIDQLIAAPYDNDGKHRLMFF
ncbi:bacillithiol biosynthesis cysteine-adding enzyme BshC [Paenibacillus sp. YN15]|uniref:bacillithiol biosynthesis cysteine-adding enzyme BshC n=1 Tax=Paenibacillus sp. YN15 TaxID=1742774 RepID=UPI00215BE5F7|nr:bacillithiol biosynthesis cysteine-adding enzyme BshC [Paenibacillus sp. YN15]